MTISLSRAQRRRIFLRALWMIWKSMSEKSKESSDRKEEKEKKERETERDEIKDETHDEEDMQDEEEYEEDSEQWDIKWLMGCHFSLLLRLYKFAMPWFRSYAPTKSNVRHYFLLWRFNKRCSHAKNTHSKKVNDEIRLSFREICWRTAFQSTIQNTRSIPVRYGNMILRCLDLGVCSYVKHVY